MQMNARMLGWTLLVSGVLVWLPTHAAKADTFCGTVTSPEIGSGNDTVVLGIQLDLRGYDNSTHTCIYGTTHNPNQLGACIEHVSHTAGATNYFASVPTCTTSSTESYVLIETGAGRDIIEPAPEWPGMVTCGGTPDPQTGCYQHAVQSWPFSFGMFARLGTGPDVAFGTPRTDRFYSNTDVASSSITPADGALDELCGFGGNDILYGDYDNTSSFYECIYGGAGTDTCWLQNTGGSIWDAGGIATESTPPSPDCESGDGHSSPVTSARPFCYDQRHGCSQEYASVPFTIW